MSKKNRRRSLKEKESILPTSQFSVDDSKVYLVAALIVFHIVPLAFVILGDKGRDMYEMLYLTLDTMFLAIAGVIYGLKKGFNFQMPLVMTALGVLSLIFYPSFAPEMVIKGRLVFALTFIIIALGALIVGAIIKKLFRL